MKSARSDRERRRIGAPHLERDTAPAVECTRRWNSNFRHGGGVGAKPSQQQAKAVMIAGAGCANLEHAAPPAYQLAQLELRIRS